MSANRPTVMTLTGDAAQRARLQAQACDAAAVRNGILGRLRDATPKLETPEARAFLSAQRRFCESFCADELAELDAMARAFDVAPEGVFALFHLSALSHRYAHEGCSAFATPKPGGGAFLAKNRDLSGPHPHFQQVFLQRDPSARAGNILHVGSLGMPGAYSSGVNARGLALADTAIPAPMHGIGWPRYLLMTRILRACADVAEALDLVRSVRHCGGGSLMLADASGHAAAVELLADGARVYPEAPVFRTNHFWSESEEATQQRQSPAAFASTTGRRATLAHAMQAPPRDAKAAAALLAHDGSDGREPLRRRGEGDGAITVSSVVYDTAERRLDFVAWRGDEATSLTARIGDVT